MCGSSFDDVFWIDIDWYGFVNSFGFRRKRKSHYYLPKSIQLYLYENELYSSRMNELSIEKTLRKKKEEKNLKLFENNFKKQDF